MNGNYRHRFTFVVLSALAALTIFLTLPSTPPPAVPRVETPGSLVPAPQAAPVVTPAPPLPPPPEVALVPEAEIVVPPEVTLPQRPDELWQQPIAEPTFAGFREWTTRFARTPGGPERAALMAEGVALAERRRNELADLIDQDPRRALELTLPDSVRSQLPAPIAAFIEERISGRGDLSVIAAIGAPGKTLNVRPVERTVRMQDGRVFETYTYGLRETTPTRANIAVQGIAIGNKLALTELPGRILEPSEIKNLHAAGAVCPVSGLPTTINGDEVAVAWDNSAPTFYCATHHALSKLYAASGQEALAGGITAQSGNTEGTKKLLIIRVDFPDFAGQVVSDATLTTLINDMSTHWTEMSFGKMTWTTQGSGSDFTPTLRLPNSQASYTDFATMLAAARAVAAAAGYNYANYTHDVVVTGSKPSVGFGGIAYVGARGAWLANSQWNLGVCSHEVGHNFGLNHSGFWDTTDGTPIGDGTAVEYGNPFDHMGGASSSTNAHYGARQKNFLDWITDAEVVKVSTDGSSTTRIRALDKSAAGGVKALAVDRTGTVNDYWVEYRQTYAVSNLWMTDGVLLNWGNVNIDNMKPLLLDWTPGTTSLNDCPVLIGRTFSDVAAGIHITPVLRGQDANGTTWMDVTVNRGAFANNRKPTASVTATTVNPGLNGNVTFTATGSDPDGDTLAYFWDWGDGTFTANNSTTATKSWSASGTKTVRCFVSDMKGQTTTAQFLVQVGTSSTFFIQGTVTTNLGSAVAGVLVKADATHSDTTDSEGYYAITGLPGGSYTITATKSGLTIQPSTFTNPVPLGPDKQNVNFVAPPGAPFFGAMTPGLLDQGSNTGAVIVPVGDADTALTSLTLTGTSSNEAIIPNTSIAFGTIGTTARTITVSAAATVSGPVNITIKATDPEGGTASYVYPVTVNAKPVLANLTGKTTARNVPLDIDLRTLTTDELTPADKIGFELSRARAGTVNLLPDGHTAHFVPAPDYHGPASFQVIAHDQSLSSRMLFLYDFEPPDLSTDARVSDLSNFNRIGTFETGGAGGEYLYADDVPPYLAPYATRSVSLSEVVTGAARIRRTLAVTDINLNDADWTFSTWVKRNSRESNDILLHLGDGDGFGVEPELQLYFPANSDTLKVGKYGAAGLEKEAVGPALAVGTWHHVTLTYDRLSLNSGTLAIYVDGFAYGTVTGVAMNINQATPIYLGGAASATTGLDAWLDGSLDDVTLQTGLSSRTEIWGMAHLGTRHYHGLSATGTVTIDVTGANQAPAVSAIPDVILPVGVTLGTTPLVLSDPDSEARTVGISVSSSSNTSLLLASGVTLSAVPSAWTSSDIGAVAAAGSFIEDHGTFILGGSGADIGLATGDEFRSVRQDFSGNAELIARVESMTFSHPDAKAGVMMRDTATATSTYAMVFVSAGSGVSFQYRSSTATAALINATVTGISAPCWLRLVRVGTTFTGYFAPDKSGTPGIWQQIGTPQAVPFNSTTNTLGLALTSKVDGTLCTAVFNHLGGTAKLGGERLATVTPRFGIAGTSAVTLTATDGAMTSTRSFNVIVDGAPPSTTRWNATATTGSLLWSAGANWSTGNKPVSSRFSTVEFFNGQTLPAGTIAINNDTVGGQALNILTLGGTGPASGVSTINLSGNALLLRPETVLAPVINLNGTLGTGLTVNVAAPLILDADTTFQGNGTANYTFSGAISGTGGLIKTGTSRIVLTGENSYAGVTTIGGGILQVGTDGAAGSLPGGDIVNNATLRFDRTGTLPVPNKISGSGGIVVDCPLNNGTIVLSGASSFTGGVTITSGALRITNSLALGQGSKTITMVNGTAGASQLRLDGSGGDIDLADSISFTTSNVNGAIFNEAGNNTIRGALTLSSGGGDTRIQVDAGTLTLEGNASPNVTNRNLQLGGIATGFFNGSIGNGSATQVLALTKSDAGTWTLGAFNTYSGPTTINAGTLKSGHPNALGNAVGGTLVNAGGTLDLNGQTGVIENITLNGNGANGGGALINTSGSAANLAGGVIGFTVTAGGTHSSIPAVTFSGGSGTGASATASLGLTAASFSIVGGTTVYSAAPTAAISGGGGTGATATAVLTAGVVSGITIVNPGTDYTTAPAIAFNGGTVTTAGTNPAGTGNATKFKVVSLTLNSSGNGYVSAPSVIFSTGTGTTATAQLSGVSLGSASSIGGTGDLTLNAGLSGAFMLTKTGTGTLTLAGTNSHAGTTLSSGRLIVAGSVNSAVLVNGGVLMGTGAITGSVTINAGTHSPGNSPGLLPVTGSYTLGAAGSLQMEINGSTAGTQYDQIKISGAASTVSLAGSLQVVAAQGLAVGTTYTLIDNPGTAPVLGTFANMPQSAEFFQSNQWWRISYSAGTGNDVVLTRIAPSLWQNWQATNFGANTNISSIAGDFADSDGDGLMNRLEYALGGNPMVASQTQAPKLIVTGGKLTLSFNRTVAITDVTLTVQGCDGIGGTWVDLARSSAGAAFVPLQSGVIASESGTGAIRAVQVRDLYLLSDPANPQRYLRMLVTRP